MRMVKCNGCKVLRKTCHTNCVLRPSLEWINNPDAQGFATLFLAKFYGRSRFLEHISAGPEEFRHVILRSLLYEACGRIVDPIHGIQGLILSKRWSYCEAAVQAVLSGGIIYKLNGEIGLEGQVINHPPMPQTHRRYHPYHRGNDKAPTNEMNISSSHNVGKDYVQIMDDHMFIIPSGDKGKGPIDSQNVRITSPSMTCICQNFSSKRILKYESCFHHDGFLDLQLGVGSSTTEKVVKMMDNNNPEVPKELELKLGWD